MESKVLKQKFEQQFSKALRYLETSYKKVQHLPVLLSENDDDSLEVWESFTARFSRVVDIYTTKIVRAQVLEVDPGFDGSFLDLLNIAEKAKLIESAELWLKMRSLRNIQAHEYTDAAFSSFVTELKTNAPSLLNLKK